MVILERGGLVLTNNPERYREALKVITGLVRSSLAEMESYAVEPAFEKRLESITLKGRPDIVTKLGDRYHLVEFKLKESEDMTTGDVIKDHLQLIFYANILPEFVRDRIGSLFCYFFDSAVCSEIRSTPQVLSEGLRIIKTTVEEIQSKMKSGLGFPPRVTSYCSSCGFLKNCPAHRQKERSWR